MADTEMAESRANAIDDLDRLVVALDELVRQLAAAKRQYRTGARSLRAGDRVATTLAKAQAGQTRETVVRRRPRGRDVRHRHQQGLGSLPPAGLEVREHHSERREAIGVAAWSEGLVAPGSICVSVACLSSWVPPPSSRPVTVFCPHRPGMTPTTGPFVPLGPTGPAPGFRPVQAHPAASLRIGCGVVFHYTDPARRAPAALRRK
jgi:hypothetical protein